jgi:hypothetical protein
MGRAAARFTSDRWHGSIEPQLRFKRNTWRPAWKADAAAGTSGID